MTNDELLVKSFNEFVKETHENLLYAKKNKKEWSDELIEDYSDTETIVQDILEEVHSVEDLKKLDEEDYAFMYECLNEYAEIFVVDGRDAEKLSEGNEEFEQLTDLLTLLEENYVPQNWEDDEEDLEESENK